MSNNVALTETVKASYNNKGQTLPFVCHIALFIVLKLVQICWLSLLNISTNVSYSHTSLSIKAKCSFMSFESVRCVYIIMLS